MIRLMLAETTMISRSLLKREGFTLKEVFVWMTDTTRVMSAGPAAKAEARNRGPMSGLFQKGLAGRPW